MPQLTEAQMQDILQMLDSREKELRAEVRAAKEVVEELPSDAGRQVEDPAEQGEQRFRRGIEHAELLRDQEELRDIEEARESIAAGTYGECVDCGAEVPFARLHAQPTAKRCVACQSVYEQARPSALRYS